MIISGDVGWIDGIKGAITSVITDDEDKAPSNKAVKEESESLGDKIAENKVTINDLEVTDFNWIVGYYVNGYSGQLIKNDNLKYTRPFFIKKGDVVYVEGQGTGIAAVAKYDKEKNEFTVVSKTESADSIKKYYWIADEDCYISISGRCEGQEGPVSAKVIFFSKTETDNVGEIITLDNLKGIGSLQNSYISKTNDYSVIFNSRYIITRPIYLRKGDFIKAEETYSSTVQLVSRASAEVIDQFTKFTPVSTDNSGYYERVSEDGWYVFSGLTENLKVEIIRYKSSTEIINSILRLNEGFDVYAIKRQLTKILTLADISKDAVLDKYITTVNNSLAGSPNTITTQPIYLVRGEFINVSGEGTGVIRVAKVSSDTINNNTIFSTVGGANVSELEGEIIEDGWYCFSGRINRNDGTDLKVEIHKFAEDETAVRLNELESRMKKVYGEDAPSQFLTLNNLNIAYYDSYFNDSYLKRLGGVNCIITSPIWLDKGDYIKASTEGTAFALITRIIKGTLDSSDSEFELIKGGTNPSFEGEVQESGYYFFSGRNNRESGNLNIEITKYAQAKNIFQLTEEKADKEYVDNLVKNRGGNDSLGLNQKSATLISGLTVGVNEIKSEIPEYWFQQVESDGFTYGNYLDDKIDSVPEGLHLIHIADIHYTGNKKHSAALIDYVRRRLGIKTIIHNGDVENENNDVKLAAKQWLDFNKDYVFRIGNDFKQVCGDHDHNGGHLGEDGYESKEVLPYQFIQKMMTGYNINELNYDTLYDERIKSYGWSKEEMSQYDAWKKMHYYFDDPTINTRFIILHTGWTGDVGLAVDKYGAGALSETNATYLQMDFLYHALMSAPENSNIIVCGHNVISNKYYTQDEKRLFALDEPTWLGSWKQVGKMIRALKEKSVSPVITYRDWDGSNSKSKSYDFTAAPNIKLAFCLGGDVHWDILAKSETRDELLVNVVSGAHISKKDDILYALTMTDGGDRGYLRYPDGERIMPPNTAGTLDEQAFDIVTLTDNAIYFTRIGCGKDRVVYLDE